MLRWVWMLGGLIVWALHFMGVYGIASLADVVSRADDPPWRMAGLAFSAACVLAALVLAGSAARSLRRRRDPSARFGDQLAVLGAGVATLAIVWQALPTVIGY
ncbi:hypothetical protein [Brevundimonas sp.]|uniref:hypothetical protein n=1 Tax=Brevundimonas sp. TaxID=1871086 RepID=UPI002D733A52|nr:hypothetical protein [Brevundimonas sp.]HYD28060.1 hypothetical protein [Brevundimonas sp.]